MRGKRATSKTNGLVESSCLLEGRSLTTSLNLQNISPLYSHMLIAQTLSKLQASAEIFQQLSSALRNRVVDVLTRLVDTVLGLRVGKHWQTKMSDSDYASVEPTAYAVLALCALRQVSEVKHLSHVIDEMVRYGADYLQVQHDDHQRRKLEHIWLAKLTYASPRLNELYCLAALRASRYVYSG